MITIEREFPNGYQVLVLEQIHKSIKDNSKQYNVEIKEKGGVSTNHPFHIYELCYISMKEVENILKTIQELPSTKSRIYEDLLKDLKDRMSKGLTTEKDLDVLDILLDQKAHQ